LPTAIGHSNTVGVDGGYVDGEDRRHRVACVVDPHRPPRITEHRRSDARGNDLASLSRNAFPHGTTKGIHLCLMASAFFRRFPGFADERDV
jgi:hypothetical protein